MLVALTSETGGKDSHYHPGQYVVSCMEIPINKCKIENQLMIVVNIGILINLGGLVYEEVESGGGRGS